MCNINYVLLCLTIVNFLCHIIEDSGEVLLFFCLIPNIKYSISQVFLSSEGYHHLRTRYIVFEIKDSESHITCQSLLQLLQPKVL